MKKAAIGMILASMVSVGHASLFHMGSKAHMQNQAQSKSDANVIGVMIALNKNEIAAAELAMHRATNNDVKGFAHWMESEHGQNLAMMESLSHQLKVEPASSKVSQELQQNGKKGFAKLSKLHGKAFDKAYITAMVKGHEAALHLVDKQIAEAQSSVLKSKLKATRGHVQHHLQKALSIQKELG